jgi:hypothetical protein
MFDLQFWMHMALGLGSLQHDLNSVQRWVRPEDGKTVFCRDLPVDGLRRTQTVTQHCVEAEEICNFFIAVLEPYLAQQGISLDTELLRQAVRLHDFGEGSRARIGHDVILSDKKASHDVEEYEYFVKFLDNTYPGLTVLRQQMVRAFLLQFCLNGHDLLPAEILTQLREQKRTEALLFMAIEKWGYLLYAMEQYQRYGNRTILADVISRNNMSYHAIAGSLPGFSEVCWTEEMQTWCHEHQSA